MTQNVIWNSHGAQISHNKKNYFEDTKTKRPK